MRFDRPLDDVFATGSHVKVLRALYALTAGLAVSGRDIARRAAISHPRAAKVLAQLSDLGLATVRHVPPADVYEANRDHALAAMFTEMFKLEARLKFDLLTFIARQVRSRRLPVTEARLFGSFARGQSVASSNVDLALVCPPEGVPALDAARELLSEAVRRRFGARLNLLIGSPSLAELGSRRRAGSELWRTIAREGYDVLAPHRSRAG